MSSMSQPHDRLFKTILYNKQMAIEFFQQHLPPEIINKINLSTLTAIPETQTKQFLEFAYTDMLFSANLQQTDAPVYIALLHAEHQSTVDPQMAWRVLQYQVGAIAMHLKSHPDTTTLPSIFSCVYYTGQQAYTAATDVFSLFSDAELAQQTLGSYQLIDLARMETQLLQDRTQQAVLDLTFLKAQADYREVVQVLTPGLAHMLTLVGGRELVGAIIEYIIAVRDDEPAVLDLLACEWSKTNKQFEELTMTIAEKLEQRGRQAGFVEGQQFGYTEGRQEGRLEGQSEGEYHGRQSVAMGMLQKGLDLSLIAEVTQLDPNELIKLQTRLANKTVT